jgi:alpha-tubulin suppressor-like RCC1 family protein
MGFLTGCWRTPIRHRALVVVNAATIAGLMLAITTPAQAAPNVAVAWGQNGRGTLGNGGGSSRDIPVTVNNLSGVTAIASSRGPDFYGQALALLENGTVWGWGRDDHGQVGDATSADKSVPVPVCAAGSTFEQCQKGAHLGGVKAIAAGDLHSLALLEGGTVVEWGSPGDGSEGAVPVAKGGLTGVKALAAGQSFSLALLENGTVMAWGQNGSGQLGNGGEAESKVPVAVCAVGDKAPCATDLSGVKAIAAGDTWGLALLENGRVAAWGANGSGQLGDGSETASHVPTVVCAVGGKGACTEESKQLKEVTALAGGQNQTVALLANGSVVAWGGPDLGNGSESKSTTPVAVCAVGETAPCTNHLAGATAVAAGGENPTASYAVLASGGEVSWGDGSWHELGDGSTKSSLVPVAVCAESEPEEEIRTAPCAKDLTGVQGIAAGDEQGFAFGPFPLPSVTAITPKAGPEVGGTSVTITGTKFKEVTAVKFGATNARSFKVNSETSITAVSPPGSGTVYVTVTAAGWASGGTAPSEFTYENLPQVGRCLKIGSKGVYKTANCVTEAPGHNGAYEWAPGPPKPGFSAKTTSPRLETVAKHLVQCAAGKFSGQWSGLRSASITLTFTGCSTVLQEKLVKCETSPIEAGVIKTEPLEAQLGYISTEGTIPKIGLDLALPKNPSNALVRFTCGAPPELTTPEEWTVEGSAIGAITPVDAMQTIFKPLYLAKAGKQVPEHFEGLANDTLLASRLEPNLTKHEEQAALTLPGAARKYFELATEEPLEIKVK